MLLLGCKMSSTSTLEEGDDNKVDFKITGSKESGLKVKN
tara:strand:- start:1454 stop:1570 length:117 start_codon:yes stop_codon:yes gene_type:complete